MLARGCDSGCAPSTNCQGRQPSSSQLPPCIRCWALSSLLLGHAAFRGRNRELFSESRMREMRLSGSMSGNRKQNQVKPDCGDKVKAESHTHRETTVTAPVLDSTHNARPRARKGLPIRLSSALMPSFQPMPLNRRAGAFNHPDWLFEIKWDGFRSLAYIEHGRCRLVSRNGNEFKSFPVLNGALPLECRASRAVLDGEIVCLDRKGNSQFKNLLFRRGEPRFYAFDLLSCDGEDLRYFPLADRKH